MGFGRSVLFQPSNSPFPPTRSGLWFGLTSGHQRPQEEAACSQRGSGWEVAPGQQGWPSGCTQPPAALLEGPGWVTQWLRWPPAGLGGASGRVAALQSARPRPAPGSLGIPVTSQSRPREGGVSLENQS